MRALICTVGKRDLTLDGATAESRGQTMRAFCTEVQSSYAQVGERLAAPIIDRALEHLHAAGESPQAVMLVVSDQPKTAPAHFRDADTAITGEILKGYLRERFGVSQVWLWPIRANPTDLDEVMAVVRRNLQEKTAAYTRLDLLVTGGTPQMTAGLLLAALEVCPGKITPLYIPDSGRVRALDVVRQMKIAQRRRDIWDALEARQFAAAKALLEVPAEEVGLSVRRLEALRAIVKSAVERQSFRVSSTREQLSAARRTPRLADELYDQIDKLMRDVPAENDEAALLSELYYNAHLKLCHEEHADFVLRLFNFHQAALRQAAERAGVDFERNGEFLASRWLKSEPGFRAFVQAWKNPSNDSTLDLGDGRATGPILLCLAEFLEREGQMPPGVYRAAQRLQPLASLRNKCFAAHAFKPVDQREIERTFGGSLDEVRKSMTTLYEGATGRSLPPDPFKATVRLGQTLLLEEGKEG